MIDTIFGGIAVSSFATLLGYIIGSKGKMSVEDFDKHCKERQESCNAKVCIELGHLRNDLKEMKLDIKEILKSS